jgi:hypothetical protein
MKGLYGHVRQECSGRVKGAGTRGRSRAKEKSVKAASDSVLSHASSWVEGKALGRKQAVNLGNDEDAGTHILKGRRLDERSAGKRERRRELPPSLLPLTISFVSSRRTFSSPSHRSPSPCRLLSHRLKRSTMDTLAAEIAGLKRKTIQDPSPSSSDSRRANKYMKKGDLERMERAKREEEENKAKETKRLKDLDKQSREPKAKASRATAGLLVARA